VSTSISVTDPHALVTERPNPPAHAIPLCHPAAGLSKPRPEPAPIHNAARAGRARPRGRGLSLALAPGGPNQVAQELLKSWDRLYACLTYSGQPSDQTSEPLRKLYHQPHHASRFAALPIQVFRCSKPASLQRCRFWITDAPARCPPSRAAKSASAAFC
jgi:hypothetical protein